MTKPGKKKIVFIINPISGVGKKNSIPPLLEQELNHELFDYQIKYTERRKHGYDLACEYMSTVDAIVAVGGDGSVNEIGSALVNSDCALGIIPCGSGNGFARHAKIPLDFKAAVHRINSFAPIKVDTGTVNSHCFLATCGFGFDAHVAKKFDEYHKRGFLSYVKLVLREYKRYKSNVFEIKSDDETFKTRSLMCSVANCSEFGNGFVISPNSDFGDGFFELVLLSDFPWHQAGGIARRFFGRSIDRSPHYTSLKFRNSAQITCLNADTWFHTDGEPVGKGSTFTVRIVEKSLNLL